MANNPNQPGEYDAVKGGQAPPPSESAILGGVEGVKSRLMSGVEEQRIAALSEALKYGEAGLDLVIEALQDESSQVEEAAYRLLRESTEPRVKQVLQQYNPWQFCENLHTFTLHPDRVNSVAISPDGQTLVSGSKTIQVWNLHTGELLKTLKTYLSRVHAVAISLDGQTLVSGSMDAPIEVLNLHTGQILNRISIPMDGYASMVTCVVISPDGQTFVGCIKHLCNPYDGWSDCYEEVTIKHWNLHTGALIRTIVEHSRAVRRVAISPDGQTLVGVGYCDVEFWNLHSGELIRTLKGFTSKFDCLPAVAINPDGHILVTESHRDNTIKLWNLHTGALLRTFVGHSDWVNCRAAISLKEKTIVSGSDSEIKVWGVR